MPIIDDIRRHRSQKRGGLFHRTSLGNQSCRRCARSQHAAEDQRRARRACGRRTSARRDRHRAQLAS